MYPCSLKVFPFNNTFNACSMRASFRCSIHSYLSFFFLAVPFFPISLRKSGKVIDSLLYVNPMAFLANCY